MRNALHCFMMMNSLRVNKQWQCNDTSFEYNTVLQFLEYFFFDQILLFVMIRKAKFIQGSTNNYVRLPFFSQCIYTVFTIFVMIHGFMMMNSWRISNDNATTTRRLNMIQFCGWLMMLSSGKCYSFSAIQPHNEKLEECLWGSRD